MKNSISQKLRTRTNSRKMLQTKLEHEQKSAGAVVQTVDLRTATDQKQNGAKTRCLAHVGLNTGLVVAN
jgi:hypothetical protein